jgi:mannose-6-phosphate isomerase-like protein (cupin superfamily)
MHRYRTAIPALRHAAFARTPRGAWVLIALLAGALSARAQDAGPVHLHLPGLSPEGPPDAVRVQRLAGDSLATGFLIDVPRGVPPHEHRWHSETVYVLSGRGRVRLGNDTLSIGPGSYLFIPATTPHAVWTTSEEPLKVLSVQAPRFTGADRWPVPEPEGRP